MGTFISWIKINENDKIFFLTDKDVFSKRGRKFFADFEDDNVLGHKAIRGYYANEAGPLRGGTDHEESCFWEAKRLPKEIQALHPEDPDAFMKHWGRMWRKGFFQNDCLLNIICYDAPESWKRKAWNRLMKQKPSNNDLRWFIYCAPGESWKRKAWNRLMKQKPSDADLRSIIACTPEPLKEKACARLMKQNPSDDNLNWIIKYAPDSYKKRARAELKKRVP